MSNAATASSDDQSTLGSPADPEAGDSAMALAAITPRLTVLDGLRGVAITILVIASGGALLWPTGAIDAIPVVRGFFRGGTVDVFFVIGGFVVARSLMRDERQGVLDPVRFYVRRLVRLGTQLVPVAAAVLAVHHLDSTDIASDSGTTWSVVNMLTHTLNLWSNAHIFEARPDLGHLWYLSVQQQAYLVLPIVLVVFLTARRVLVSLLVLGIAASSAWRIHVLDTEGWLVASTSTATRIDGVLLGVLVAVTLAWWQRHRRSAGPATVAAALSLTALLGVVGELPEFSFLGLWGLAFNATAAVLLAFLVVGERTHVVARTLSIRSLAFMGRASLAIFVWHLPVFAFVSRHTTAQPWPMRAALAFALLAFIVAVTYRWIEQPAQIWLQSHLKLRQIAPPVLEGRGASA